MTAPRSSLLWVTASLTAAIGLVASLVIATTTRGDNASFASSAGQLKVQTVASGLVNPWALAFLPDGRMLVTEKPGRIRVVSTDGKLSPPLKGVPEVSTGGQGGLLDLVLDRRFGANRMLYFCYAERIGQGGRTAVARAKLAADATRLDDVKVIFRQDGPLSSGNHYGCRIAQAADDNLFVGLGRPFHLSRRGAEPCQSSRQDDPHHARWRGPDGQSLRRPRGCQAGDLELRPPQHSGRRDQPGHGRSVGNRAWPARWR